MLKKTKNVKERIVRFFFATIFLLSSCNNWTIFKPQFKEYGVFVEREFFFNTINAVHSKSCFSFVGSDYKNNCEIKRIESAETHITNEEGDLDYLILEQDESRIVIDKNNNRMHEESSFNRHLERKDKKTIDIKAHNAPGKRKYYYEKATGDKGYVVDLLNKTATLFVSRFHSLERMGAYAESNRDLKAIDITISSLLSCDGTQLEILFERQNQYYSTKSYYVNDNVFTFVGDNLPRTKSIIQIQYNDEIKICSESYSLTEYSGYHEENKSYLEVSIAKTNHKVDLVDFSNYSITQDY